MKKIKENNGTCYLCQQIISHRMIKKHLARCLEEKVLKNEGALTSFEKEKVFLIKIFSGSEFWLYLEINGRSRLQDLDRFLRSIWLECCGHMSQFTIDGRRYVTGSSASTMKKEIHSILEAGTRFFYEYDFGSATELEGEAISARPGRLEGIRLLARNTMPEGVLCSLCQQFPEVICTLCFEFCCKKCRKKHACQEDEMMLPVVNSPRMGMCGYCGPSE